MTKTQQFEQQTKALIDDIKKVCANYGLGNDGNEFKVITQVFLYKFLNDKYVFEIKKIDRKLAEADNWEEVFKTYSEKEIAKINMRLKPSVARISPDHFITSLFNKQDKPNFAEIFDGDVTFANPVAKPGSSSVTRK